MRTILLLLILVGSMIAATAQTDTLRALSPEDFASWTILSSSQISADGEWVSWEENAQQYGDGSLLLQSMDQAEARRFARGGGLQMAPTDAYFAFRLSPHFDSLRQAKLDEVPEKEWPKDTLALYLPSLGADSLRLIPRIKSFQVPDHAGEWMAYHLEQPLPEQPDTTAQDTVAADSAVAEPKPKTYEETSLVIYHPLRDQQYEVARATAYAVADSGRLIAVLSAVGDSIDSVRVTIFDPAREQLRVVYEAMGQASNLTFDRSGRRLAFFATTDTGEVKVYALYGYQYEEAQARKLVDTATAAMAAGWAVSQHSSLSFSRSGNRLFFGTAPIPEPEPEDTLLDEEKTRLDVWTWQDPLLQPDQLLTADEDRKKHYRAVWHWSEARMTQLAYEDLEEVRLAADDDGPVALGYDSKPYHQARSWDYPWRSDVYVVDVETGERNLMLEAAGYGAAISPRGRYLVYWDERAQAFFSLETASGNKANLTEGIDENFFDEEHDSPFPGPPYGGPTWLAGETHVILYDRYDLWKVALDGSERPVNLTRGWGRDEATQLRIVELDRDALYAGETLLLRGFDEADKGEGFYQASSLERGKPEELIRTAHSYGYPRKADQADRLIWTRETYREYPNLHTSDLAFGQVRKLSDANPQQDQYRWGDVRLVTWTAYDGTELEGLLYTPEDFDPEQEYPLLVYFYEKVSDRFHNYSTPSPSRSIIYPSYYNSNGYVIFMPNIVYQTGQPGPDAYNCIVSGTEAMVEQFPWIDENRMALQGQSWGGYQTAYLVTQTNLYACAMAGAPVSNMTSAYGGIRWGSGLSRMFQYERTQSRLGTTLWEDRERYIKNSPLFFADQVETPLLMMHNDDDGAVPWYQGIEYFVALRRLQKPVWMLVYNGEEHNLTRWPNRMDLTIRMHQFFDHYLQGAPMPVWMAEGVPAVDKGRELGYEMAETD